MSFDTYNYMAEEDVEDSSYIPLKVHSLQDFLDSRSMCMDAQSTEQQHVSSNVSEESEGESLELDNRRSLRLAPLTAAADRPRECYCLDNVHCICGKFILPPLLTRNATPALQTLTQSTAVSHSTTDEVCAPKASSTAAATTTTPTFGESMYISLCSKPVKLTAPVPVMSLRVVSPASMGATETATATVCRC